MVVGSAIEIMRLDPELASIVKASYKRNELKIEELVRLGQADGSISASVDCKGAARLMLCTVQGMRVVGKLGKKKDEMMDVVKCALKALD
jgi:TetR/AcrR family transcriptional repressor of nem operon